MQLLSPLSTTLFIISMTYGFSFRCCLPDNFKGGHFVNLNTTKGVEVNLINNYTVSDTSFNDIQNISRSEDDRNRIRVGILERIKHAILVRLGFNHEPNMSKSPVAITDKDRERIDTFMKIKQIEDKAGGDIQMERGQSFYPSCSLPRNAERDTWEDSNLFHIYYNISYPRHVNGISFNITMAKLRLYKNGLSEIPNWSFPEHEQSTEVTQPAESERIRISVFQYTKPLRRYKKAKKKLSDSKMVPINYEGWTEFNVYQPIRDWLENPNKNFGLEVILEDAHQQPLNPTLYLRNINCSDPRANESPFPRFMEDEALRRQNESSLFDNETYPTLDLQTVQYQEEENINLQRNSSENRRRRHAEVSCEGDCCRESTYVTFKDLGWDEWIMAPKGFHMTYCIGSCSKTKTENTENEVENEEQTTCVPAETSPLMFAYLDENDNTFVDILENFFVKSCTCKAT